MDNAVILPLTSDRELVVTSDNSGAIGKKPQDAVHVSNEVVGSNACRVAMMECLAARGSPYTIVMQNFTNEQAWETYQNGVHQVICELELDSIPITGSTESNFSTMQSGLGLTVIGTRTKGEKSDEWTGKERFAAIGTPLVGEEVIEQQDKIAPLSLFRRLCQMEEVKGVQPVGSKGIVTAWKTWTNRANQLSCAVDVEKSAGPATCFLIAFDERDVEVIQKVSGGFFQPIRLL